MSENMRTWLIWTEQRVTEGELRAFVISEGGYWNDVVGDEAVIERDDARLFIAIVSDAADALPDDVEYAIERLGYEPASMLSVRIGHHGQSIGLAESVGARAVQRWGGFIDRNEPIPNRMP